MYYKIDKNLLQKVQTTSNKSIKQDCIIFGKNYDKLVRKVSCLYKYDIMAYYPFINSVKLSLNLDEMYKLSRVENVKYISSVAKVTALMHVTKEVHKINIMKDLRGSFSVCIIDTGIYPHLDFVLGRNRIVKFVDMINNITVPYDDNGHGTFTAGVLSGTGLVSNKKYSGVYTNANIISVKALDKNGETSASTILSAMQWVMDNKDTYNIKVVCMSFGADPTNALDPLMIGAEVLWNNGITVVSAAGNSGPSRGTIKSPGTSNKIITVGALDDRRENGKYNVPKFEVAEFSSRGPAFDYYKPDVLACGVNIISTNNFVDHKFYTIMSGTSVSTPVVAGIASRMLSIYPKLTPMEIKTLVIASCNKLNNNRNSEGFGWVDVENMIKALPNLAKSN